MTKKYRFGILAFGSLISDPGPEIPHVTIDRVDVETPFKVEYARQSHSTRAGAPTLTPVAWGGAVLKCKILVLDESLTLQRVQDLLYRREKRNYEPTTIYSAPNATAVNRIRCEVSTEIPCCSHSVYTRFLPNIHDLSPGNLAKLAIQSARDPKVGNSGLDGITYLRDNITNGIVTPLTDAYRAAILAQTNTNSLDAALHACRNNGE